MSKRGLKAYVIKYVVISVSLQKQKKKGMEEANKYILIVSFIPQDLKNKAQKHGNRIAYLA